MLRIYCLIFLACTSFVGAAGAGDRYGVQLNFASIAPPGPPSRPLHAREYGVQLQWFPQRTHWADGHAVLFLQGGYEYMMTTCTPTPHDHLYSLALGPMLRANFFPKNLFNPFIVLGAQPGYLSKKQFRHQRLGIKFALRDTIGLGVDIGVVHPLTVTIAYMHYSNADISETNNGLQFAAELSLGYRW